MRQRWLSFGRIPAVRPCLFFLGWLPIATQAAQGN
jgi:hypothetical protein